MNTRAITRSALAVVGVAGVAVSMSACSMLGGGSVPTAEVGDCVDSSQMDSDEVTEIPVVDCSEEHDLQVFHKFDIPDGDFPGDSEVRTAAQDGCLAEFEPFVGQTYEDSALDIQYVGPSQETWDQADDREVICFVFAMDGSTTTESYEGSGL